MKKAFSLALLMVCLFVAYQIGVTFFKQTHEITYSIKSGEYLFSVNEKFREGKYYFQVRAEGYDYYIEQENSFNKMKQVIKNFEVMEENGMMCIYPVFKEEASGTIICSDKNQMYSYESVKTSSLVLKLQQYLKNQNTLPSSFDSYQEQEATSGKVTYYPSAMEDEENIVLWYYQGFSVLNKERSFYQSVLSFDRYENTLSHLVGKYYITPLYKDNRLYEFSSVFVFDVSNNKNFTIDLGTTLSNYTYQNGVVEGKSYFFDKNTIQQIEINPKEKSARVVANQDTDALMYNGHWESRNIYDFVQNKIPFSEFDDSNLKKLYSYLTSYQSTDSYYFYDGNGFYQVYKDYPNLKILLFEQAGIKDIKVIDGYIYYILGDTLYKYSPKMERRRILKYSELLYNSSTLYDIYRK